MTARAIQPVFPAMPKRFEPMLDCNGVRAAISEHFEYTMDDLEADVDRGCFEWVFNIATSFEGRRELRLFKPGVEERLKVLLNPKWRARSFTFDDVTMALFPSRNPRKPWVTTPDVMLAFVCDHNLVLDLLRASALHKMPGTEITAGKGNATQITWESITGFLQARRIE